MKYIIVTGGVASSLGKGGVSASIGAILKSMGLHVSLIKIDPYINVDAGTMSPYEHGEVFVLADGTETDQDLGNYERFIGYKATAKHSITTGKIYRQVIDKERNGSYLGKCVQIVPHATHEVKEAIKDATDEHTDIAIVEIGGTVGDIESALFIEAVRQLQSEVKREEIAFVHLTLIPRIPGTDELKTKPTQNSVKILRSLGIQPDILMCREENPLSDAMRKKIALFTGVAAEGVLSAKNFDRSIYELPINYEEQGIAHILQKKLDLLQQKSDLSEWEKLIHKIKSRKGRVKIGVIGKYTALQDAYKSLFEALFHGGLANGVEVERCCIESQNLTATNVKEMLQGLDGILIPGGFGDRGIEGKFLAARYARENNIPFFGICLGLQIMAIEYARNVLGLAEAHSLEFDPHTTHPIVATLETQKGSSKKGGTMRLGNYRSQVIPGTLLQKIYQAEEIEERHRHRYEVNNQYIPLLTKGEKGMCVGAYTIENGERIVEALHWKTHTTFSVGVQYHPEFTSSPFAPHPLFIHFIQSALDQQKKERRNKKRTDSI